jgi:hypothetical protein
MQPFTRTTVVGMFHDRPSAEQAIEELRRLGFGDECLGVAVRDGPEIVTDADGTEWEIGATAGAIAGGATGTLLGIAVAAGLIPGIGPVIAGGLLGGLLASAATGAVAGGVLGALIGLGVPEEEAAYYSNEFESGRVLVTVQADDRADVARSVLRRFGAYDIEDRDAGRTEVPLGGVRTTKDIGLERMNVEGGGRPTDAVRRPAESGERVAPPPWPPGV